MGVAGSMLGKVGLGGLLSLPEPTKRIMGYLWEQAIPGTNQPGIDTTIDLFTSGILTPESTEFNLGIHGAVLRGVKTGSWANWEYNRGVLANTLSPNTQTKDPWSALLWSRWKQFDLGQIVHLLNRGVLDESTAHELLRRMGYRDGAQRDALLRLRFQIPSTGTILDMSLRGALEAQVNNDLTLMAEYPRDYDRFARAQGVGPVFLPATATGEPEVEIDFAAALWALHWQLPTAADMLRWKKRLRPTGGIGGGPRDPSGLVINPVIEESVFKQNSIHPDWRPVMDAMSHPVVSVRHARLMYESNTVDGPELVEIFKDQGYNDRDARRIARANVYAVTRQRRQRTIAQASSRIEAAWDIGTIDDLTYIDMMKENGLDDDEAGAALSLAHVYRQEKRVAKIIRTLRSQFLAGKNTLEQTRIKLRLTGIQESRVNDYLDDWEMEMEARPRELQAGKLIQLASEGLIGIAEVFTRLTNLRWAPDDINLLLTEAQLKIDERLLRMLSKQQSSKNKGEQRLKQQQEAARQAVERARKALSLHGSPAKLKTWYCDNLIGEAEVYERLRFLGWPDVDIERLLDECEVAASKKKGSNVPAPT